MSKMRESECACVVTKCNDEDRRGSVRLMSTDNDNKRIAAIRTRVHEERSLVYALSQQLTGLQDLLKPCNNHLDDVSFFFLDDVTLEEKAGTPP